MFDFIINALKNKGLKDEEVKIFRSSEIDDYSLKILNKNKFNIYKSINTFLFNSRKKESIYEFRGVFIDIDLDKSGNLNELKNSKYNELFEKINLLKKEHGIYPSILNETYKGFHIVYLLKEELYFLKSEIYLSLLEYLTGYFDGDQSCIDVSRLYKMNGFRDNVGSRNFLIKNKIFNENKNTYIGKKFLVDFNFGFEEDIERKSSLQSKGEKILENTEKKDRNYGLLSEIGFSEIAKKINNTFAYEKIKIQGSHVLIDNVEFGGLIYNKDKDYINDFSHGKESGENRGNGNKNFLMNLIFKDDFQAFVKFLLVSFGIKWNKSTDSIIQPLAQSIGIINKEYSLYGTPIKENVKDLNDLIFKGFDLTEFIRYIISIYAILNENNFEKGHGEGGQEVHIINFDYFLQKLGFTESSINNGDIRQKIKKDLITMSYLKRETIEEIQKEDGEVIKIINLIPLFNIGFSNNAKKKGDFFFIELEKFNKVTYLNKNLGNFRTKNNDLLMLAYKLSTLNSKQKYGISEEKLRSFLNLSTDNLKKYKERVRFNLNTLKENGIITDYEINSKNGVNIITG